MLSRSFSLIKFFIITFCATILIFLVSLFLITQNLNTDTIKNQLEQQLSQMIDSPVTLEGDIKLTLFPKLHLAVNQVNIADISHELSGSIEEAHLVLNPFYLLRKKIFIHQVQLINPDIRFHPQANNKKEPPIETSTTPADIHFTGSQILLKHLNLDYQSNNNQLMIHDANLLLYQVHSQKSYPKSLQSLLEETELKGRMTAKKLDYDAIKIDQLDSSFTLKDKLLKINHIEGSIADGHLHGKGIVRKTHGLLTTNSTLELNTIKQLNLIAEDFPITAKQTSLTIESHSSGYNSEQLLANQKTHLTAELVDGIISGIPIDPLIQLWNHQAKTQQTFTALPSSIKPNSAFSLLHLEADYHNQNALVTEGNISSQDSNTYLRGFYNFKTKQYLFHLLINLPHLNQQPLRNEMNGFFWDSLVNTIPMLVYSENERLITTLDTDYLDVSKLILGKGLSRLFKNVNYKAFSEDEKEIKSNLFQAFKEGFNPEQAK